MKYYTALYLENFPEIDLPVVATPINFAPHVSISVFDSDKELSNIELFVDIDIDINLSIQALHGRNTQQIMLVCPVLLNPKFESLLEVLPKNSRDKMFYHVTVGKLPMTNFNKEKYKDYSVIVENDAIIKIKSKKLIIEQFKPVLY